MDISRVLLVTGSYFTCLKGDLLVWCPMLLFSTLWFLDIQGYTIKVMSKRTRFRYVDLDLV